VKQTFRFAGSLGEVTCEVETGRVAIPVIPGILKHPASDQLAELLRRPGVAVKYTTTALERAAWPVLSLFPAEWLLHCLPYARLKPSRRAALLFLLS
jgi:hypothetical protein